MKCLGIEISRFSIGLKIHELSKSKTVKYGSNVIGMIPALGTLAGIVRIAAHLFFRKCKRNNTYFIGAPIAKFRGIKVAQGAAELIPLFGPGIFWISRGSYLAVKQYQNYKRQQLNPFGDDND